MSESEHAPGHRPDDDLIGAAKDLLSALRGILILGADIDLSYKENRDRLDAAIRDGWAAIAKAEGRKI